MWPLVKTEALLLRAPSSRSVFSTESLGWRKLRVTRPSLASDSSQSHSWMDTYLTGLAVVMELGALSPSHLAHLPDLRPFTGWKAVESVGWGRAWGQVWQASAHPRSHLAPSSTCPPILGKKCTYGVKCRFYHPERSHHAQLPVADELRAKTRAWPGGGAEEQRPPSVRSSHAAVRLFPREPGAPSLPPLQQPTPLAALSRSFSRLTFSETRARGVASRTCEPDWMPTSGPTSWALPSPHAGSAAIARSPGLLRCLRTANSPLSSDDLGSPTCPQARPLEGHPDEQGSRDMHSDLVLQHRPLEDPWSLLPSSYRYPSHSAWAESVWGEDAFRGPSGSAQPAASVGGTRTIFHSVFPADQVDPGMASDPALSDLALLSLQQRSQRTGARLGDP